MAHIDALIDKVSDPALRAALREQIDTILNKQSFGLVYQQHQPETVELIAYRPRRGCKVRIRSDDDDALYRVEKIAGGSALVTATNDSGDQWNVPVEDLVVVREFGEAIYPGLETLGRIERGGDKPFHAVINAENYHALEMLMYAYEGTVDAIYIDPPYNTGARDWKYNNDYVDGVDQYRHSKWLAFIERRLTLARRLLNPASSVLIVTIDEKEIHHLGMLLEQMFPDAIQQMVTIVINPLGQARKQELGRVEEYAFFVFIGNARPSAVADDLLTDLPRRKGVRWEWLLRGGTNSARRDRPNLFFPIFIDPEKGSIVSAGPALTEHMPRSAIVPPDGQVVVWPLRTNGDEGNWRCSPGYLMQLVSSGHAKVGAHDEQRDRWSILYLGKKQISRIATGELKVTGHDANGAVILEGDQDVARTVVAKTVWNRLSHRAGEHGSGLLRTLLPGRDFPFPKSLYAVEDALRIAVGDKPNALILDFFVGSGTTAHAVARLNAQDGGARRSIVVTNNEVSAAEAKDLREAGWRPGDAAWEERGIYHYITKPRVTAAITGCAPGGGPIPGSYLDETPFATGLAENVEFFNLTYEDPDLVSLGRKFKAVAPLLWLKAGGRGACIESPVATWAMPETARYGVLFDINLWRDFLDAARAREDLAHIFVVTDSEASFQHVLAEVPNGLGCTQLYEDYLRSFQINTRGRL